MEQRQQSPANGRAASPGPTTTVLALGRQRSSDASVRQTILHTAGLDHGAPNLTQPQQQQQQQQRASAGAVADAAATTGPVDGEQKRRSDASVRQEILLAAGIGNGGSPICSQQQPRLRHGPAFFVRHFSSNRSGASDDGIGSEASSGPRGSPRQQAGAYSSRPFIMRSQPHEQHGADDQSRLSILPAKRPAPSGDAPAVPDVNAHRSSSDSGSPPCPPGSVAESKRVGGGDAPRSPMLCGAVSSSLLGTAATTTAAGGSDARVRGGGVPKPVAESDCVGGDDAVRSPMVCGAVSSTVVGTAAAGTGGSDVGERGGGRPSISRPGPVAKKKRGDEGGAPRSPMVCGAVSLALLGTPPPVPPVAAPAAAATAVAGGNDVGARGGRMPRIYLPVSITGSNRVSGGNTQRSPVICRADSSTLLGKTTVVSAALARGSDVGTRGGGMPRISLPRRASSSKCVGGGDAPRSPMLCGAVSFTELGTAAASAVAGGRDVGARDGGIPRVSLPGPVAENNRVCGGDAPPSPTICGAVPGTAAAAAAAAAAASAVARGRGVGARGDGMPRVSLPEPVVESNRGGGSDAPRSPVTCGAAPGIAPTAPAPAMPGDSDVGARGGGMLRGSFRRAVAESNGVSKGDAPKSPMVCGAVSSTLLSTTTAAGAVTVAGSRDVGRRGGGMPKLSLPRPATERRRVGEDDAPRSPTICGAVSSAELGTAAAAVAEGSDIGARGGGMPRVSLPGPVVQSNRAGGGNGPRSPSVCGAVPATAAPASAVAGGSDVGARGDGMARVSPQEPVGESDRVGGGDALRSPVICRAASSTLLRTAAPAPAAVARSDGVGARGGGMPRISFAGPVGESNRVAPRSPMICGAVSSTPLAVAAVSAAATAAVATGSDIGGRGGGMPRGFVPRDVAESNRVGGGDPPRSPMICGAASSALLGTASAAPAAVARSSDVGTRGSGMARVSVTGPVLESSRVGGGDAPRSPMICGAVPSNLLGAAPAAVAGGSGIAARGEGMPKISLPRPVADSNRVGAGDAPRSPMICGAVSLTLLPPPPPPTAGSSYVGVRSCGMPTISLSRPVAESDRVGGGDAPRSPMLCGAVSPALLGPAPPIAAVVGGGAFGTLGSGGMPRKAFNLADARNFVLRVGGRSPQQVSGVGAGAEAGVVGVGVGVGAGAAPPASSSSSPAMRAAQPQNTANAGAIGGTTSSSVQQLAGFGAWYNHDGGGRGAFAGMPRQLRPPASTGTAADLHQAGRHTRVLGVGGGRAAGAASVSPSASRNRATTGARDCGDKQKPLLCEEEGEEGEGEGAEGEEKGESDRTRPMLCDKEEEGGEERERGEGAEGEEEEKDKREEEEEDEEEAEEEEEEEEEEEAEEEAEEEVDNDDNGVSLLPIAVPEGKTLSKCSWCCGVPRERYPPASICSVDIKCPKWQCRRHTHVNNQDKETFSCCCCEPHLKQGCGCHA